MKQTNMKQTNNEEAAELTFEVALNRLEEIVRKMESSDLSLQDSLDMFQDGVALIKGCHGQLDQAEAKVQQLVTGDKGIELQEVKIDENGLGI